jgi:hypothetical protein
MPSSQHALMEATKRRAAKMEVKGKPVDFKPLLGWWHDQHSQREERAAHPLARKNLNS